MRDFSKAIYKVLLDVLQNKGYEFQTFRDFLLAPRIKSIVLRHDVDKSPHNSLAFAETEQKMGLHATYFFRIVDQSFKPSFIQEISACGHEIGYHYEDMDACGGDVEAAWSSFKSNLAKLRELAPIQTICMHGSPLSPYDNRSLWGKYDYRDEGIIGEPYFDIDFSKVYYLSDTGRRWNHKDASLRDKVVTSYHIEIKNTNHLIQLIREGKMPDQIMITTHPQRWNDNRLLWFSELISQNAKNVIKTGIVKKQSHNKDI